MELAAEFFKRAEHYSLPNPPHRVKVKVEIMQRVEGRSGHLADDKQVAQIRTRAMSARVAAAVGIGWQEVLGVAGILDGDRAAAREQLSVSSISSGEHTIEQVDPPRDAFEEVVW